MGEYPHKEDNPLLLCAVKEYSLQGRLQGNNQVGDNFKGISI